ncbi:MAG: efflux RND transporter permease subunit [Persephonella sp.]|nr:efflux RND transporter permease subunit [Persephonella sp.]
MNTLSFVLRRPHLIISLLLVFSVIGILGFFNIKQKLFPDVNRPTVSVVITYPGASAYEIAQDVAIPVEKRLSTISRVRTVYSTTNDELTVITAEFEYEKEISEAVLDVQNELNKVYPSLPEGVNPPQIYPVTDATPPVLVLSLSPRDSSLSLPDLRQIAENQIKNRLLQLKEVANVDIFGDIKRRFLSI